jgi:hypothetical protein
MLVRSSFALAAAALAALGVGCATTTPAIPRPVTEPVVDQPGSDLVRYRDATVEIVLDTGFADGNLGADWLVLNAAFSGMTGAATAIGRDRVSVRAPDGTTIPLPSYREFRAAFDDLAAIKRRAALASQPLDFTRGGRRSCGINFMPDPGSGVTANTVLHVSKNELCVGLLYFPIPGGVQPGTWRFVVDFEESRAVVPFTLGAP